MKIQYQLAATLLSAVSFLSISAQDYSLEITKSQFKQYQVIPPSPDASALGKYGNVPVSLFTGTPNINMPLMELKGNVLNLPVSASYNASGFKPEEMASWIGLGWALNAGGVITRSVAGNPDVNLNYFKSPSPIKEPNDLDEFDRQQYFKEISEGIQETQPDMYFYNFMGKTGKFYIKPNGLMFIKERTMLAIGFDKNNDEFEIRDEQGNRYQFDQREVTSTMPSDEFGTIPNAYNYTSAWYLSSVTSADGTESILFEYYAPSVQQELYQGSNQQQSTTYSHYTSSCSSSPPHTESSPVFSSPAPTRVTRKFLKKIRLVRSGADVAYIDLGSAVNQRQDLWNADFDGERRLDNLKMYSNSSGILTIIKDVRFSYSYFPTTASALGGLKLRLDNIQEKSIKAGTPDKPAHAFEYNTGNLPRKFPLGLDHWGYYNGASNTSLLPSFESYIDNTLKVYGGNANREPSFNAASLALIKKITYPTGGYSTFEFEGHTNIGGVRIKKITDYSFDGTVASAKTYTYGSAMSGSKPKYVYNSNYSHSSQGCVGGLCNCPSTGRKSITITSSSIFGLGFSRGTPVAYSFVTESVTNASGAPMGKTVYNYSTGFPTEADDDISTGTLVAQRVYGNGEQLLTEIINTYTLTSIQLFDALRIIPDQNQNNSIRLCEENVNGTLQANYYVDASSHNCVRLTTINTKFKHFDFSIRQQKNLLAQQIVKQYDPITGNYLTTTKKITYGTAHISPIRIEEETSNNGELVVTDLKYISDYTYHVLIDPISVNHQAANLNNIKSAEVEKVQYRMRADGSNKRYINGQITTYLSNGLPDKIFRLEIANPLTAWIPSSVSSGGFTYNSNYKQLGVFTYNASLNLIEQTKTDDIPISYTWDYMSSYPVASVSNAKNSTVAYTGFETISSGGWVFTQTGFSGLYAVTGKRSLNFTSATPITKSFTIPSTVKQIVSYWSRGAAITVKANSIIVAPSLQGAPINGWYYYEHTAPIGTTSLELSTTSATIDELRTYPIDAYMTTYSYDPEAGMTSQCDPFNIISYYEYDGLNRLVNVRDNKGNIIKNFQYNYGLGAAVAAPPKNFFYNTLKQQSFTKSNCAIGAIPSTEVYVVGIGKYSALTQLEADNLANADLVSNGQSYANREGTCIYKNISMAGTFYRECEYFQGQPKPYGYVVPAGRYTSAVSQEIVDQQALWDLQSNGQNAANENGICLCMAEGKRFINGTCQTGTRINYSYTYIPASDNYKCNYYYVFSDNFESQHYFDFQPTPCYSN